MSPILNLSWLWHNFNVNNGMTLPQIKILVADDDPEDLELMEEHILSVEPKAQLNKFKDGLSAYEYLHSRTDTELPSLIILDYNMPGLNGCQVLSFIKTSRYRSIPKIILSNSNTAKYIAECLENGATEYIVKPSSMDAIHTLAKKLVSLASERH
jgi:CheY-like chemotaxis protein